MNATRTRRPAATATGMFGLRLRADNPLVLAGEGALFAAPRTELADVVVPTDEWALDLDFTLPAPRAEAAPLVLAAVPVATYAVWYFDQTAQAVACLDREEIAAWHGAHDMADGDVVICEEESVAGVVVGSWIVAVTEDAESFEIGELPAGYELAAAFAADFMA